MASDTPGSICVTCQETLRHSVCDVCGNPITKRKWLLSDGRVICGRCHATSINQPEDASTLYEEMKLIVKEMIGLSLNIPTGLALVDRNQLAEVIRKQMEPVTAQMRSIPSGSPARGVRSGTNPEASDESGEREALDPQRTLGVYARRGMRRGIYIQTGLPRMLFLQVAAHEYAHAWQGENCPLLREALFHEGFAEWIAYKVLGHYGYSQAQKRMLERTDVYGRGLLWVLKLESSSGAQGVYEACRRAE